MKVELIPFTSYDKNRLNKVVYDIPDLIAQEFGIDCTIEVIDDET